MAKYFMQTILMLALASLKVSAQPTCPAFTKENQAQLEEFVKKWYHLPAGQTITLVESGTIDSACYRKLVFRASVPAPLLKLYLAPDGKHLAAGLMDLTVDPVITQRKNQVELEAQLMAGALFTSETTNAPVNMVVFSDFQCPYCKRFAEILQQLTPEERSRFAIVFRQFPLNIHSWARQAAEVSTCVALQDKAAFWKLHDFLFAQQQDLSPETLQDKTLNFLAHETKVDPKAVTACLTQKTFEGSLHRDEQLAVDLGITSTPSVFLHGRRISVRSVEDLRTALHTELASTAAVQNVLKTTPSTDQIACARSTDAQCAAK